MLTPRQEAWVNQIKDKPIIVVPYDPRSDRLFEAVKKRILTALGSEVTVEHSGASGLGISGQDEIDVTIAVHKDDVDKYIPRLEKEFGPVQKRYPDRVRFAPMEEGKRIDLKISDKDHEAYLNGKKFEKYLSQHLDELERYRALKESLNGAGAREYYRKKIEFINEILAKA